MPRKYQRKPGAQRYKDFSPKCIEKAVKVVRDGQLSYRKTAEVYSIPKDNSYRKKDSRKASVVKIGAYPFFPDTLLFHGEDVRISK